MPSSKAHKQLPKQSWFVLSYCEIPENVADTCSQLKETTCDVYVEHGVTGPEEQKKYDDDFTLDNWILSKWPDLEGEKILIHIDY